MNARAGDLDLKVSPAGLAAFQGPLLGGLTARAPPTAKITNLQPPIGQPLGVDSPQVIPGAYDILGPTGSKVRWFGPTHSVSIFPRFAAALLLKAYTLLSITVYRQGFELIFKDPWIHPTLNYGIGKDIL